MVQVRDEGSEFEAPVEVIWKYLATPEVHGPAHKSRRTVEAKPVGEATVLLTFEQKIGEQWVRGQNRITRFPPVGMAIEMLEGPLAGSKMFTFYTPKGARTGVTVVGEFTSPTLPPHQVEAAARASLAQAFDDDAPAIKEFAARK
jgi:hypothetical protein